jgi:hypothetical protein
MAYHFKYNDELLLTNSIHNKNLHLSQDVESPVSKNMEVSLCETNKEKPTEE